MYNWGCSSSCIYIYISLFIIYHILWDYNHGYMVWYGMYTDLIPFIISTAPGNQILRSLYHHLQPYFDKYADKTSYESRMQRFLQWRTWIISPRGTPIQCSTILRPTNVWLCTKSMFQHVSTVQWSIVRNNLKPSETHGQQSNLVGGIPTPLKNISQLGLLFPIYGKIKFMFQTTNQIMYYYPIYTLW